MTATFGRLENETLALQPGLNVRCMTNEAGKSTWAAFILAMLYGVDTAERARPGVLPVKTKYLPWGLPPTLFGDKSRAAGPMADGTVAYGKPKSLCRGCPRALPA